MWNRYWTWLHNTHTHTKVITDQTIINLKSEVPACLDRIIHYEFGHFCSSLYEGIIEVMLLGNTFSKVSDYCLCHWCPSGQNKCIMCYLKWLTRCFIGPDRWSLSGTPNTNFYTHIFLIICLVCLVGKIYPFVAKRTETWWLGTIIAQEGRDPPNSLHLLL